MNIPTDYYFIFNVLIVIIYLLFIISGYKKGLIYSIVSLVYTILSIFVAWYFSPVFASTYPIVDISELNSDLSIFVSIFNINYIVNFIIYFVIIILLLWLVYFLLSFIFKSINKIPLVGKINQMFGALVGVVNATIVIIGLSILLSLPIFKNGKDVQNKTLFKYVTSYSSKALEYIVDNIDIEDNTQSFDIEEIRNDFKEWLESTNE